MVKRSRSKRYLENKKKVSELKTSTLNDAIKAFKSNKAVKFDETLDISVMLNKEKNKGEGLSRGYAQLPNGTGKKMHVAVFAEGDKAKEAKDAGADVVGNEDLIKDIKDGKIITVPNSFALFGVSIFTFFLSNHLNWKSPPSYLDLSVNCRVKDSFLVLPSTFLLEFLKEFVS